MHLRAKTFVRLFAILATLSSVSARADATYAYTDPIELHVCVPNSFDAEDRSYIPFAGVLCPGAVVPYASGHGLLSPLGGDACSVIDDDGAKVFGTKFFCPSRELQLSRSGDERITGLLDQFDSRTGNRGNLTSRAGHRDTHRGQSFSSQETASFITSLVGRIPVTTADRDLLDAFVRVLLEQHPQLLLPKKYEGGVGLSMPIIRAAMAHAVVFYRNWYRKNKEFQKDPDQKLSELPLKRAIAANFDPDPKYQAALKRKSSIVIFDMTKPRDEPRFYVINTQTKETGVYHVKHGKGSGKGDVTKCVSNRCDSNMSPFGFHYTGDESYSKKMKREKILLIGLESINSNSEKRGILIHPTKHINEETGAVKGCTLGCAGINEEVFNEIDQDVRGGNLVLFYHQELEKTYAKTLKKEIFSTYLSQNH